MESKILFLPDSKLNIEYCDTGKGHDTIFFLCGFGQTFSVFTNLFLLLENDYRIVSINYPGFGKSDSMDKITVEKYAEIINEFVNAYELKNYFICGDSFGGYMSLYYANKYNSANIKALILLSPYVKLYSQEFIKNSIKILKYNLEKAINPKKRPSIPHVNELGAFVHPRELYKQGQMILETEFDDKLLDIKKDFLVIVGDQDNLVDPQQTVGLLKEKSNVKIEKITATTNIEPRKESVIKKFLSRFKKDVVVEEITIGTHGCYMEIGDRILQIVKNFTSNYA